MIQGHHWKPLGTNRLVSEPHKGYYHFRRYRCRHCGAILVDQVGSGPIVPESVQGWNQLILEGPDRERIAADLHRASRDIARQAQAFADAMGPGQVDYLPELPGSLAWGEGGSCNRALA